ncbi:MAG: helix-turn-helix domain-containing protein [Nocardioidaceae bacterium]|nr:helix-turn-helix domain-containing protein [Nocardioidaceae bacterium]
MDGAADLGAGPLGACLRRQRERVSPALVGSPRAGPRRRAGLRRSEVAELAGISEGYYASIEQGRSIPSAAVVEVLVNVLRFDPDERAALLAAVDEEIIRRAQGRRSAPAPLGVRGPAFAVDLDGRVLAWNGLAGLLLCDLSGIAAPDRTLPRLLAGGLAERLDDVAALLRAGADALGGRRLDRLLGTLLRTVPGFGPAWAAANPRAEVWRAFPYGDAAEVVLRRAPIAVAPGAASLSLSYEPAGSELAERALTRLGR